MLNKLTKQFILNERLKVDAGASVQALYDIINSVKTYNKRDTNRLQVAKEHLRGIKQQLKSLNERISSLEEELDLLKEEK